jgi:hypothetical protein
VLKNITFEENSFIYKALSFDKKNNSLEVSQFDKQDNFIKNTTIKMAQIPKKVKQKLNPLK